MPRIIYTGPSDYDLYMGSAAWKVIRAERIIMDDGQCTRCGSSEELQVHHLNYNRLGYETMDDLRTLCKVCHQKEHGRDPVVSFADASHRGHVSTTEAWAQNVRVRAARAEKELEALFDELWLGNEAQIGGIRKLMAEIMETIELDVALDAEILSRNEVLARNAA